MGVGVVKVISGYKYIETIHKGHDIVLYRAKSVTTNEKVIIKSSLLEHPTFEQIEEFKRETDWGLTLSQQPTLKFTYCTEDSLIKKPYLVSDDYPILTLAEYKKRTDPAVDELLLVIYNIVKVLGTIHQQRVVHHHINPTSIFIVPETKEVILSDFRFSTLFSNTLSQTKAKRLLEQSAPYLSPEQTGRMGKGVDYRTDFYSLGVTLYELVTGTNPYQGSDYLDWVHAHIGKQPLEPVRVSSMVPKTLSRIIVKLLSKSADDRYQSIFGLLEDIKKCIAFLENGTMELFELGEQDRSTDLAFSRVHFVGRVKEKALMNEALERISYGDAEVVLISGPTGVGKTSLVDACFTETCQHVMISGKFQRVEEKIPYGPLIEGFTNYIHKIIAAGPIAMEEAKWKFTKALGGNAALIADVLPDLRLIIGPTEPVQPLPTIETENRFRIVFHDFFQCIRKENEPLVLFLDDLQWMDKATLSLLTEVFTLQLYSHFLVVGTYREEELENSPILQEFLTVLAKKNIYYQNIKLEALDREQIEEWLNSLLTLPKEKMDLLVHELMVKTLGNPLFLHRTLRAIYDRRIIYFDHYLGLWKMDNEKLSAFHVADNVIDLLIEKLGGYSERSKLVLQIASCIGNIFEAALIEKLAPFSNEELMEYLSIALKEGLIIEKEIFSLSILEENRQYMFAHDEIWKAVYSQISKEDKSKFHWKIGKAKLALTEKHEDVSYDTVQQLNFGLSIIQNEKERKEIAYYNLKVGEKAFSAIAYHSALDYFQKGIQWLGKDPWIEHQLCYALTYAKIECLYLVSRITEAETELENIMKKSKTKVEKVKAYQLKIRFVNHLKYSEKAVEAAHQGLALLDYNFPKRTNKALIAIELLKVKRKMKKVNIANNYSATAIDETNELLFSVLQNLGMSLYQFNSDLYGIHILKMLQLHIKHPGSSSSALSFAEYAVLLSEGLGQYQEAYHVGKQALELTQKYNNPFIKGIVYFVYGGFLNHWEHNLIENIKYLKTAVKLNRDGGNFVVAGGGLAQITKIQLMCGVHLDEVYQTYLANVDNLKALRLEEFIDYFRIVEKVIQALRSEKITEEQKSDINKLYNYLITEYKEQGSISLYVRFIMICYLFFLKDYERVVLEGEFVHDFLMKHNNVYGPVAADFWLYYSISICLCKSSDYESNTTTVKKYRKKLKKWAKQSPENFKYRSLLLDGVWFHWNNESEKGISLVEQAFELAEQQQCFHHQALISSLLGKFFSQRGKESIALKYSKDAYLYYQKWGALSLANQIIQEYGYQVSTPQYISAPLPSVDAISLIKASHVLSKEIVIENVLTSLIEIVLQTAAAQYGVLLLMKNEELYIDVEASGNGDGFDIKVLESIPLNQSKTLPLSVIHYVSKLKQPIIHENLSEDTRFSYDSYISNKRPKSALCMPIMNKGDIIGILYLENNLSSSAFTKEHITILELLTIQAAISIENARLYSTMQELNEQLEEKVEKRTRFLEQSQRETAEALAEKSVLQERNRIAREIHDVVGHTLTTTIVQMEASKRLFAKDSELAMEKLNLAQELIRKGLQDIRKSVKMLKEDESSFDLLQEMKDLVTQTSLNAGVEIETHFSPSLPELALPIKKVLYHALQEGLTNGIRHGNSTRFIITLEKVNHHIVLIIKDNGVGVDKIKFGFGLEAMKERVEELQGRHHVTTEKGKGVIIEISIPVLETLLS